MKYTGITRPIDELGRIVIPKEIRNSLNINSKDLVEIYIEGDMIILKKNENRCSLCGGYEDLIPYNDRFVCRSCAENVKNLSL